MGIVERKVRHLMGVLHRHRRSSGCYLRLFEHPGSARPTGVYKVPGGIALRAMPVSGCAMRGGSRSSCCIQTRRCAQNSHPSRSAFVRGHVGMVRDHDFVGGIQRETRWRTGRDSNPRYPCEVRTFSKGVLSTTQPPILGTCVARRLNIASEARQPSLIGNLHMFPECLNGRGCRGAI